MSTKIFKSLESWMDSLLTADKSESDFFVISFRKTVIFIVHECVADFIAETESA